MGSTWDEREQRFEERPVRTAASATVRTGVVVAVAIAVVLALSAAVWWFGVKTSDVKGRGDAEVVKNEAGNRIRAQEGFEQKFANIKAADQNINVTAEALKSDPDSVKLKTELQGQKQACNALVAAYNAASRKFTQGEFRAADLPFELNVDAASTKPETDCKENSK
jgi:FlaG/FlaF family flagellin (archaellin)